MPNSPSSYDNTNHTIEVFRILDAEANRAGEGLRVVESYVRFILNDAHLMGLLKELRHQLANALQAIDLNECLTARDTLADVGTSITTSAESHRPNAEHVLQASLKRSEQALRSLEEYSKILSTSLGHTFEQLRYLLYTLEKAIHLAIAAHTRLTAEQQLYVLTDGHDSVDRFEQRIDALIAAQVDFIQLRDKHLTDAQLLGRAKIVAQKTRSTSTTFIMNDRPDLARLSQAGGVHVGQEELPVHAVRQIIGSQPLVGVSTHSLNEAKQAVLNGASYIGVGPVFPSQTKRFDHFVGLQLLTEVAQATSLPAFAIGGIDLANLPEVLATGFIRVAVGSAITSAKDVEQTAGDFKTILQKQP